MTYCLETTRSHDLTKLQPSCCEKICDIVIREGGRGADYPAHIVLNLDSAEKTLAKKEKRPFNQTMDIAFGGADLRELKKGEKKITKKVNKCFVLVDFKLNTKNCNFSHKSDFEGKVRSSKVLLAGRYPIYFQYYFIYPRTLKQQAIYRIARLFNNQPKCPYIPLTEGELFELWFSS